LECISPICSRRRLEVENLFLRHQLNIVLRRTRNVSGCGVVTAPAGMDDTTLAEPVWFGPVVQPDSILRWHRAGFKAV
jgi:hypothetical protein